MAGLPIPGEGILLSHFPTAADVEHSARFYSDVLGGEIVRTGRPTVIALANAPAGGSGRGFWPGPGWWRGGCDVRVRW